MALRFLTAGESHGPGLSAILEGMPAGLPVDLDAINHELLRRQRGVGAGPRMKLEKDTVRILSGIMEGVTIGAPLALWIKNLDHSKWKGKEIESFTVPRPGHADLTGAIKFGYDDLRPGLERASARETAARVVVGAICKQFLNEFGIRVGGYVCSIGDIDSVLEEYSYEERMERAEASEVRCPDILASEAMSKRIKLVMQDKDTLGGIIEIVVLGLPPGLGSYMQWNQRLEARLGAAILSVQAIKGVEFGPAFNNTRLPGSQVQDAILLGNDRDQLYRPTNRAGGVEGGVSNGQPLIIRAAMKPIATTLTPQHSIDLAKSIEVPTRYERSDFCPVPRAVPVLEAMTAFVLADALLEKLGGDSMAEILPRFTFIRQPRLSDLKISERPHIFWPDGLDDPT